MTEKELLYIEDALGHEEYFQIQCRQTAQQLQDAELRSYVQQVCRKHQEIYGKLYQLL